MHKNTTLGLPKGEVFLVSWNKEWENEFNIEKNEIMKLIGTYVVSCQHIGSTAVKGLSSKPIIDIAIEINKFEDGFRCIHLLSNLGYRHRLINELPDRHYFSKGEPRTHQIHMYQTGNIYLKKQIIFRNCLIENEDLRNKYQKLKTQYALKYNNDKLAYADAKTEFIRKILEKYGIE